MRTAAEKLKTKIAAAVITTINEPDIAVSNEAAAPIIKAVTDKIAPEIINATNQEPWYQSMVTLATIAGFLTVLYTMGLDFADGTPPSIETMGGYLTTMISQGAVLYGRWVNRRPVGQ